MNVMQQTAAGQAALWNGPAGRAWVESQAALDRMFRPLQDLLLDIVAAGSDARVLDVGCGTGSTTLALARRLGAAGSCIGVDISAPMIALARSRAGDAPEGAREGTREGARARFLCADAGGYGFAPADFDAIVSRMGVMFFADPVQAFANLRRAARDDAELRFIAWRQPVENPFMTTAERAAAPLLPALPARRPDAPGQFAFADRRRVGGILADSGWAGVGIEPVDLACSFAEADLVSYFTRLGPLGLALDAADAATRRRIVATVRAAFEPYVHGDEVRFTAACWKVSARAAA